MVRFTDTRATLRWIIAALEGCDGIRIKDRRIKVDVERGRTVKGWLPRRFGGGLGGRGYTKALPARPIGPGGFGGGFRGGFRGGFEGGRGRGGFRGGFQDRGFRGGGGGGFGGRDRGFGGQNGYGGAPPNAPPGPGGGRSGGLSDSRGYRGDSSGGYDSRGGGRSYDDRHGGGGGGGGGYGGSRHDREPRRSGSNMEPIRPRENGGYRGSDRDRDYDRPRDDDSRKRGYEGGYEDPRKLRRY